jgi:acylphosphatase
MQRADALTPRGALLTILTMLTLELRITGRVQGVGFRYALRDEANRLGINGWVRNRRDGSVEALVQGAPAAVEALVAWARRGPPGSRVCDVIVAPAQNAQACASFEIRPSV